MSGCEYLSQAYRATRYEVPSLGLKLFIDQPSLPLDVVLRHFDAISWAFISVENPRSQRLDARTNAERHHRLREHVAAGGWRRFEGYSIALDGGWPPESALLVLGIGPDDAVEIGRDFEQNAIVVGRLGLPPMLRWCE